MVLDLVSSHRALRIGDVKSNHYHRDRSANNDGFRFVLQAELARRCSKNPQYSLRAFASYLEIDHSTLSQYLRGKRRLTERAIRKFGIRLGFDPETIEGLILTEQHLPREDCDAVLHQAKELACDTVNLLAEWHHYAILELVRLRTFRPDTRWIARVLGISEDEVNVALQRLLRLQLLEMAAPDRWIDRSGNTATSLKGFAHAAVERLLLQVRQLMVSAIDGLPEDSCSYSATTLAVDMARVPAAMTMIDGMRRELLAFLDQGAARDDVYHLEISFVPATQLQREEISNGTPRR